MPVDNLAINDFLRHAQIKASENNPGNNEITGLITDINNHPDVRNAFTRLISGEEFNTNDHAILTGGSKRLEHLVFGIQAVVAGMSPPEAYHMYEEIGKSNSAKNWLHSRLGNLDNVASFKIATNKKTPVVENTATQTKLGRIATYKKLAQVVKNTATPAGLGRVGAAMKYTAARTKPKNSLINTGKKISTLLSGQNSHNSLAQGRDLSRRIKKAEEEGDFKLKNALKKELYALRQSAIGRKRNSGFKPNANFAQRLAGRAQVYNLPRNVLNGNTLAHFRTLENSNVGFEQAIGKMAGKVMDNRTYGGIKNVLTAPRRFRSKVISMNRMTFVNKAVVKWRTQAKKRLGKTVARSVAKLGGKIALKEGSIAVIGAITGGTVWVIGVGYETINFLTGGLLDKIIGTALKLLIKILLAIIIIIFISFCFLIITLFNNSYLSYFIPNRFKLPRPVAVAGLTNVQNSQQLKVSGDNTCPWQNGTCTQGAYGCKGLNLASHYKKNAAGKRESFSGAIDVGLSAGTKLRAPESGTVLDLGSIQCADGTIAGGKFTLSGDSGTTYNFLHANATASGHVEKDAVIGEVSDFTRGACMTGAHVHTSVTSAGGKIVNAEDFFNTNGCSIDCSVACAVPDNIVPI